MKNKQPSTDNLQLDTGAACAAKRALQAAYDRIAAVRQTLFGSRADSLDLAARDIVVGITLLRDSDRQDLGTSPFATAKKPERPVRTVSCPFCGTPKETFAKFYVQCLKCKRTWSLFAKNPYRNRRGPRNAPNPKAKSLKPKASL